jgi:hypothetical protein
MTDIVLTGLDGSNPLGFLAGLGVLNVLGERGGPATLAWRSGDWRPIVHDDGVADGGALIEALRRDLATWKNDPCLALKYEKARGGRAWDLKPPPSVFRDYLDKLVKKSEPARRRSVDFAAAFATETAQDKINGNTKPTALHFTMGRQQFLEMVARLQEGVTADDFREALFGDWRVRRPLPVLGWDSAATRDYALRASDPSKEKKEGVPGAEWLAFRGLSFIRVASRGDQIVTTGCSGGWKSGRFCWPLWDRPLARDTVQVVLQTSALDEVPEMTRRARGISAVFSSAIRRSDQSAYGGFAPAMAH